MNLHEFDDSTRRRQDSTRDQDLKKRRHFSEKTTRRRQDSTRDQDFYKKYVMFQTYNFQNSKNVFLRNKHIIYIYIYIQIFKVSNFKNADVQNFKSSRLQIS